ncbi:PAAR domain-containing protein [Jiella sonneratiae]|uniref:PAAR domain-containing protein n=1 Tax=Jiella sonneratiae TaxID=2816856 RepID=A0ABS3J4N1_9HYPH|nr:PAAR domain-containing protein [Jiella sonneratiae]MBO0904639.1 PAAR domain-containing protein [Jiella sonneratiae]
MPTGPAARRLDPVAHRHPGRLMPGPGSANVVIGGLPAWRARIDRHECRHGTGVVVDGSPTVLINGQPACRLGDTIVEGRERNLITGGCPSVIVGDGARTV